MPLAFDGDRLALLLRRWLYGVRRASAKNSRHAFLNSLSIRLVL